MDINGYYENHDHDDRYYTQAQVDANFVNTSDLPETFFVGVNSGSPGVIVRSSPGVTLSHAGGGAVYNVTFPRDVTSCYWNATLGGPQTLGNLLPVLSDLGISASQGNTGFNVDPDAISVAIFDDAQTLVDTSFNLIVTCP